MILDIRKYTRERVSIMDNYSVNSASIEQFLESFSSDEKEIGMYIYKRRDSFPNLIKSYKETKSLIEKILKSFGYNDSYIKSYINNNKFLLLITPEEIYRRLAILSLFGIDERTAMDEVYLIANYTDSMIYLAAKGVKEQKERLYEERKNQIDKENKSEFQGEDNGFDLRVYPEDIRNFICNNELNATRLTSMKIDSLTRRYVQTKVF